MILQEPAAFQHLLPLRLTGYPLRIRCGQSPAGRRSATAAADSRHHASTYSRSSGQSVIVAS